MGDVTRRVEIDAALREHLIEHLEGEVDWWQDNAVGGQLCPECCRDQPAEHECLYRQAVRVLKALRDG